MAAPSILVYSHQDPKHLSYLPSFADIHIACMKVDDTVATFLPPWDGTRRDVIIEWWRKRGEETETGSRSIVFALVKDDVAGVVMLDKPFSETGPFRAGVEKLFVHPNFRQRYCNLLN